MSQAFGAFPSSEFVQLSRADIEDRTESLRSSFSGAGAPTTPAPVVGQFWYETDTGTLWVCTNATGPVWAAVFVLGGLFLPLAGGALSGVLELFKGANVPSAATLNLDTATGNYVHVTGTTGVTAVTLSVGDWRIVCFDGAADWTASSTLILPGTATGRVLKVKVGDVALIIGEGASTARMVALWKGDGTSVRFGAVGVSVASASSIDLRDVGTDHVLITGTTNISTINMLDGQRVDLSFAGALNLVHSSTLQCPQSIDFPTQNGTRMRLRRVGTDTIVMSYMNSGNGLFERGKHVIPLGAESIIPRDTNGCAAPVAIATTTNHVMEYVADFDGTAQEHGQFRVGMPPSWDAGTIEVRYRWRNASGTGNVIWGAQALARGDDDAVDTAFGTAVELTDGVTAAGDLMISAWSGAITAAGTPAAGKTLYLMTYRKAADANDTLNGIDARLCGIDLRYGVNKGNDA